MPITIAGGVAILGGVSFLDVPTTTDPYFNQVSLLLHGDGTTGAQNNTFLDSSTNNFTVTRNGNTTQGTNTPFSQPAGYWSNFFDGTGDFLNAPANAAFNFGTGDWTVECWFYLTGDAAVNGASERNAQLFSISPSIDNVYFSFCVYGNATTTGTGLQLAKNLNTAVTMLSTITIPKNTWNHVAVTKSSSTIRIFLNGTQVGTSLADSTIWGNEAAAASVGRLTVSGTWNHDFPGYISNMRVVKGTAVYTTNFTPPTTPLTAITNTSLLTCQSNFFKDNSSNNFAITPTGTPLIQPFSPFAPTAAYSTSVNGGSMYFDGSDDYLSVPDNLALNMATSDFTLECWIYLNSAPGIYATILDKDGKNSVSWPQYAIYVNNSYKVNASFSSVPNVGVGPTVLITSTATLTLNQWFHVAVTKSGANATLWVNGVSNGTSSSVPTNLNNGARPLLIGWEDRNSPDSTFNFPGYISNTRVVKGNVVYTTAFTPPTAPLTAITNTSLLLGGTNAGIFDNAIKNDLETVGNAQVSTSVVKYGTGSMAFDGTGDWLSFPPTPQLQFASGDFTIELWANFSVSTSGADYIFVIQGLSGFISNAGFAFLRHNSNKLRFIYTDDGTGSSGYKICNSTSDFLPTTNVWYHLAVTRNGNTFRLFIDGVQVGSSTLTTSIFNSTRQITIGADTAGAGALNGYIDDLRITKGVARYTANFTPPTAAFLNQ